MVIMGFTLVFLGGSRKKHTEAYVGIQMSGLNVKRTPTKKWGIVVGGVFCPIPSKTPLGVNQQHPNGPYCTWTCVRNPIFDEMGALCPDLWLSLVPYHTVRSDQPQLQLPLSTAEDPSSPADQIQNKNYHQLLLLGEGIIRFLPSFYLLTHGILPPCCTTHNYLINLTNSSNLIPT